ncbi:MAG: ROK family protein [Chitinophagales bacterium]
MKEVVLGVDIGGTGIKFGIVDRAGKILATDKVKTKGYPDPAQLPIDLFAWYTKTAATQSFTLKGVGIGSPNGNYYTGNVEFAPNLPWKDIIPLKKLFSDAMGVPAALTNDAKAAALGEMYFGNAKGMKDFLFITLGTGLGSGIVVNGRIAYGYDSLAGELGHIIVFPNGRLCGCGRRGCLEQYASATGIVKTYYELLRAENVDTFRTSIGNMMDSAEICKKAEDGDAIALEAFQKTGETLGFALANSVCYTRPEKIFLFGGLAQAGDLLFKPTIENFEKNLLPIYKNKIPILPSGLKESEAAILGSASLIWNELDAKT